MTSKRLYRAAPVVLAIALAAPPDGGAHHAVLRFNLEEMTVTADRIFVGKCVAVEPGKESIAQGLLPVTRYTFEVERVVKGQIPGRFTFVQLGQPAPLKARPGQITMHGQPVTPATILHGMSDYRIGQRLMLFLIPDYLGGKVTYPVGLDQGAFTVSRDSSGAESAHNNLNNLGLLSAPYNGTRMSEGDARVIHPDRGGEPPAGVVARASQVGARGGSWPLETLLGLTEQIHAAHDGARGQILAVRPPAGGAK